jgi:hypothetical protein
MTSFKQIEVDRLNADRSTGPRSYEGKQRSRQNAFRRGLSQRSNKSRAMRPGQGEFLATPRADSINSGRREGIARVATRKRYRRRLFGSDYRWTPRRQPTAKPNHRATWQDMAVGVIAIKILATIYSLWRS